MLTENGTSTLQATSVKCSPDALLRAYKAYPDVFRTALSVRLLEAKFLDLFSLGKVNGTVHTCVGQELIGPAIARCLQPDDFVVSNHRGHGHFVACTGNDEGLVRELMGRTTGVSGGIGGSQHLVGANFLSNGIQGGMVSIAAGVGLASRLAGTSHISVAFIGDGTLGQGALYEALNAAGAFRLPLFLVLERNGYAQSTATSETTAGCMGSRFEGFGAVYAEASIWNPAELIDTCETMIASLRKRRTPHVLDIGCYRLNPHSKGDDNRDPAEVAFHWGNDPLSILIDLHLPEVQHYLEEERSRIDALVVAAERDPELESLLPSKHSSKTVRFLPMEDVSGAERINQQINRALCQAMENDERVVLLGEDICDRTSGSASEYGGAFKVTRGLSTRFPDRVINFPISESALIGMATGLAIRGFRPVVEVMFGDFLTLCFDQILQHAAKFRRMYNGKVCVPLLIRTPMGGKRGYGPTHSQSLEKFLVGVPGLRVVALNDRISPTEIYASLFADENSPVLIVENKVLYTRPLRPASASPFRAYQSSERYPTVRLTMDDLQPDVTLFCYGEMLQTTEEAAIQAFVNQEIVSEIVCPIQVHPLPIHALADSVARSRRLVTVEEGPTTAAVASELVAQLAEEGIELRALRRVGNNDIVPSAIKAEANVLPSVERVLRAIENSVRGT